MTSQNFTAMHEFRLTAFSIKEITDAFLMRKKKGEPTPKYVMTKLHSFIYKITGATEYRVGNETLILSQGEILYVPQGISYISCEIEQGESYVVSFLTNDRHSLSPFVIELSDAVMDVEKIFSDFTKRILRCEPMHSSINTSALYRLIWNIQKQLKTMLISADADEYCRKAEHFIGENLNRSDLTLAQIAEHIGISENHIREQFVRHCGMTPTDYILKLRVIKAKKFLVNSDAPIYAIAEHTGFSSVSYFGRFFKEKTGMTPLEYRKACKF